MNTIEFFKTKAVVILLSLVITSCSVSSSSSRSGKIPPGQAKKISGSKSAKAYAPGQQKKH
ncbi:MULTISPECIES: hypothetical protein [Flavobacterium]|uniref:hypothetical protein n=1 Tax=Flavobacterium TaxID=237 RepID=UPI002114060B|nr:MULTISPECIES: hypothetical protein [Flavobacterium]UUF12414.1 hypothetical protein NLJ00_14250 [Flavobacterium panici]